MVNSCPIITDWVAYDNGPVQGVWRRVGDTCEVQFRTTVKGPINILPKHIDAKQQMDLYSSSSYYGDNNEIYYGKASVQLPNGFYIKQRGREIDIGETEITVYEDGRLKEKIARTPATDVLYGK